MGNDCKRLPPPQQIVASENDRLNVPFELPNFCGPAGTVSGYVHPYLDKAKEYQFAGEGSQCRYCSVDAPRSISCTAGCSDVSCCAIIGNRAKFERGSFKGDVEKCCLDGPRIDDEGRTCHPDYTFDNLKCKNIILRECLKDKSNFLRPGHVCAKYAVLYPGEGDEMMGDACNDPVIFNSERELCKSLCLELNGQCDTSSMQYCSTTEGNNDSYCSCINDTSDTNPICNNNKTCQIRGYITNALGKLKCIINKCIVDLSFQNIRAVDIKSLEIAQSCDGSGGNSAEEVENNDDSQPVRSLLEPIKSFVREKELISSDIMKFIEDNSLLLIVLFVIILTVLIV